MRAWPEPGSFSIYTIVNFDVSDASDVDRVVVGADCQLHQAPGVRVDGALAQLQRVHLAQAFEARFAHFTLFLLGQDAFVHGAAFLVVQRVKRFLAHVDSVKRRHRDVNVADQYQLTEMAEPDWCCGMGGSFNLQYYDISKGIGMKKAVQIRETGADVLTTGCPACMIQISDMLSQAGADVAVRHPVELYAEALEK